MAFLLRSPAASQAWTHALRPARTPRASEQTPLAWQAILGALQGLDGLAGNQAGMARGRVPSETQQPLAASRPLPFALGPLAAVARARGVSPRRLSKPGPTPMRRPNGLLHDGLVDRLLIDPSIDFSIDGRAGRSQSLAFHVDPVLAWQLSIHPSATSGLHLTLRAFDLPTPTPTRDPTGPRAHGHHAATSRGRRRTAWARDAGGSSLRCVL